jgi:hypothetical protein
VKLVALLPATAFIFGCLAYGAAGGPAAGSRLLLVHALLSIAIVFVWFLQDAKARQYKASILLKLSMPTLTFAALPYYLFRSRGLVGGLKAAALAILVFVGTMVAYHAGAWLG